MQDLILKFKGIDLAMYTNHKQNLLNYLFIFGYSRAHSLLMNLVASYFLRDGIPKVLMP